MTTQPDPEEAIVDAALEMPAHERAAYLDKLCGNDRQLRQLVDALLHAHKKIISSQITPPRDPSTPSTDSAPSEERDRERLAPGVKTLAVSLTPIEKPGDHIGRYKLLEQIGEGGFGVVYVAEQSEPVKRRVALKIVKLGMDTRQVVGRFEAERQALALIDHPNIAKVFDGGATEAGRPYFVMELVRGIKVTDYCDQNNLPTIQRLELFIQICHAIQHAHQKGIIHRDIKPSNILVTLHDGVPVPKVIDFGIAKAIQQELTEKTVYTQLHQFIGTPAYMSPEQAEMSGSDIDTRSDIYSLGVLLYELLTGKTPFEGKKLVEASLDEMRRTIREEEPPRPSTRLSTMAADALTTTAKHHHTDALKLIHLLRGDLDWIVMKALEKDRMRRYETANGLARDILRHLSCEPVIARPPSRLYEFQKTVRRHKFGFAAAAALVLVLAVGVVVSTLEAIRATRAQRDQARQRQIAETKEMKSQQVAQFLKDMLKSVDPVVALGRDTMMLKEILGKTAERVGKDLQEQPEVQAELLSIIGHTYLQLGEYPTAEKMHREALRLREALFGRTNALVAASLNDLAKVANDESKPAEAEPLAREALAIRLALFGVQHPDVADSLATVADVLNEGGRSAEAEPLQRQALGIQRKVFPEAHPEVVNSLIQLGTILASQNKLAEAKKVDLEALALSKELWGDDNPEAATLLHRLGLVAASAGKLAEAEALEVQALAMRRKVLGNEHLDVALSLDNLWRLFWLQDKVDKAEAFARDCLAIREKKMPDDWRTFASRNKLGVSLLAQKRYAEAEPLLITAYVGMRQRDQGRNDQDKAEVQVLARSLVQLYEATGRSDQAAEWKQKLAEFDHGAK